MASDKDLPGYSKTSDGKTSLDSGSGLMTIFWLLILIFFAWPIAMTCAGFYVCMLPCIACFPDCIDVANLIYKGFQLPFVLGVAMRDGSKELNFDYRVFL